MDEITAASENNVILDKFLSWCERMGIPPDALPRSPKSLFKNPGEASVWIQMMSEVNPKCDIKNMKHNILINNMRNYQQSVTNKLPEEIIKAQRMKSLKLNLKIAKDRLQQAQLKMHSIVVKKNIELVRNSSLVAMTDENILKTNIYDMKTQKMKSEIGDIRQINEVLKAMRPAMKENINAELTIREAVINCLNDVKKFTILRENKQIEENEDDVTDKVRILISDVPALNLWSIINDLCRGYACEMNEMVSAINLKADEYKILAEGTPLEHSLINLSAEHIQTWGRSLAYNLEIMDNNGKIDSLINNGLSLGDIVTLRGSESNIQQKSETEEYKTFLIKKTKLLAQIAALKQEVTRIETETNKLNACTAKFLIMVEDIKNIDIKIEEIVAKIKIYAGVVQSATDRLNILKDINNEKFSELVLNSKLDVENSAHLFVVSENNSRRLLHSNNITDFPSYLPEIEYFGKINISNISKINIKHEEKYNKLFVNTFNCRQLNSLITHKSNIFNNNVIVPYILPVEQLLKLNKQVQYYNSIKKIEVHTIPSNYSTELFDTSITSLDFSGPTFSEFNKKIDNMQKLQNEVLISFKNCRESLDIWLNNPVKNYLSVQRRFQGKLFQEYQEEAERYLTLLQ